MNDPRTHAASRVYETGGVTAALYSGCGFCSDSVDVRIHVIVLRAQSVACLVEHAR